ncbi:class A beta-lactamase [Kiloniella majae]|uniref:class A beta-lactamase n=1 Tax=Kiloniella majae TaxID=1938558 RepID=UPI000A2786FA|nr:class A beta-lactamase [Kiloniella majae]
MHISLQNFQRAVGIFCLVIGASSAGAADRIVETVTGLEESIGGRIGVAVYDLQTGQKWEYRSDEKFPMSSTFKPFACAALLTQNERKDETLERMVSVSRDDLVSYSPVIEKYADDGEVSLRKSCEATVSISDNTAGNLVLKEIGGPEGFTRFMRSIGDNTTRLDRWETELNEAQPDDLRDTTSPKAIATSLQKLLLEDALSPEARIEITNWMLNDRVADDLFRSRLPKGWKIADKTGAGGFGSRGIIAVIWPPSHKAVVASVYMTGNDADFKTRNAAIAEIGAAIFETLEE